MKKISQTLLCCVLLIFVSKSIHAQTLINNLASLQTYSGSDYVYLKGYFTQGDYGKGLFMLKTTSNAANGGTIFNSPVSGKKWFRVYDKQVHSTWFKSTTSIDDATTINNAISYAANKKEPVYIPSGEYNLAHQSFINIENLNSLVIKGDKDQTILKVTSVPENDQSVIKVINSQNITITGIKIKGDREVGISISGGSKNINLDNLTFEGITNLNQCIYLFDCSNIKITQCYFFKTGYQIIQKEGFSSNNVLVKGCFSENCSLDFIELNSEGLAPSKDWVITNNIVKKIGLNPVDTVGIESRFIGVTNTDGVIISNNIIEDIAGDAVFHFEKFTGKVLISNNVIRNPHGKNGRLIFNGGGDEVATSKRYINFINNYVEINKKFTDDAASLVYSGDVDSTKFTFRDNIMINNTSQNNLNVITKAETDELWNIVGNKFENFSPAIRFAKNAGHTNISQNTFKGGIRGIEIIQSAGSNISLAINGNSFENVTDVISDIYKKVYLQSFRDNTIKNSSIDLSLDLLSNNFLINANTSYKSIQRKFAIGNGSNTTILDINNIKDYNVLCWVEISNGPVNRVRDLVRFSRHLLYGSVYDVKVEVLSHQASGNYPIPQYSVSTNGLNAVITGSGGGSFNTVVKVINSTN